MKRITAVLLCIGMLFASVSCTVSQGTLKPTEIPDETQVSEGIAIYVSANGDDGAAGTREDPVKTVEEAVKRISKLKSEEREETPVTVLIAEGEYVTSGLQFSNEITGAEESPITFRGTGNVLITGGITLDTSKFSHVDGEMSQRLDDSQRKNVYVYDLGADGVTAQMLGTYEDGGKSAEVFCNDNRMTLARYPDEGFIKILSVFSETETGSDGGVVALFEEDNERALHWQVKADEIMLKGYVGVDWSMFNTPLTYVNTAWHLIKLKYKSPYGLKKHAPFYLYNIFEELTKENEYYIDRETMLLYVYSEEDISSKNIVLSLLDLPLLKAEGAEYVSFEGITFGYTKTNCIELSDCDHWTFENCTVKNVGNWAMMISGTNIHIDTCEIYHTGFGGISVSGGDKEKLISSGNVVENCYVHDWSEIRLTHGAGIEICGCGNVARHNELARCPYFAIYYDGANEVIEYNYIHEAVQQSHDCGAIYSGRSWTSYNDVIRYNIIENVGNESYHPVAIYWDDTLSGQTAYGNIINNAGNIAVQIGGGRDNTVKNNIILNSGNYNVTVDKRGLTWTDGWLDFNNKNGLWADFEHYRNLDEWKEQFPQLLEVSKKNGDRTKAIYVKAPANCVIENNIFISPKNNQTSDGLDIVQEAREFGRVEHNYVYSSADECLDDGTYNIKKEIRSGLIGFIDIPVEEIGRLK